MIIEVETQEVQLEITDLMDNVSLDVVDNTPEVIQVSESGLRGEQGEQGIQGEKGDKGDPGEGLTSEQVIAYAVAL